MSCQIYTLSAGQFMSWEYVSYEPEKQEATYSKELAIDGHFWLEDDEGKIIEATPFPNDKIFTTGRLYYKKTNPVIQKLAIEMSYRHFEGTYGFKRDSKYWEHTLKTHDYKLRACFHNALAYNYLHGNKYKLVFGMIGTYHDKRTKLPNGVLVPPKSVFWIHGFPKYTSIHDFMTKGNVGEVVEFTTYEEWDNRDNK